jgi:hypothetical protein
VRIGERDAAHPDRLMAFSVRRRRAQVAARLALATAGTPPRSLADAS